MSFFDHTPLIRATEEALRGLTVTPQVKSAIDATLMTDLLVIPRQHRLFLDIQKPLAEHIVDALDHAWQAGYMHALEDSRDFSALEQEATATFHLHHGAILGIYLAGAAAGVRERPEVEGIADNLLKSMKMDISSIPIETHHIIEFVNSYVRDLVTRAIPTIPSPKPLDKLSEAESTFLQTGGLNEGVVDYDPRAADSLARAYVLLKRKELAQAQAILTGLQKNPTLQRLNLAQKITDILAKLSADAIH